MLSVAARSYNEAGASSSRSPTPLGSDSSRGSTPTPVSSGIQRATARHGSGLRARGRGVSTPRIPRQYTPHTDRDELGQDSASSRESTPGTISSTESSDSLSVDREEEVERMSNLGDREHTPQASFRHVHFGVPDRYHIYTDSPEESPEPSGSGHVGPETTGSADAGPASSMSLDAIRPGHTTLRLSLRALAKPVILYVIVIGTLLVLGFVLVTALQSQYSPTSYSCYGLNPNQRLSPYRHNLIVNVTAHTPFLTALNQASTLDALRQHRSSSQSSLDQLTSYLISNLPCTFRVHNMGNAGDTVTAIWTTHSLAVDAHYNISALQSIYDDLTPRYHHLEASALESYRSASPVATKRFILSAQPDAPLMDRWYAHVGWGQEWTTFEESRDFARKRKQDGRIAKREAEILGDRKEELGLLATELKALEKALSAGFPVDAAAGEKAGRDEGGYNRSGHGAAPRNHGAYTSPDDFQQEQLKQWYWTYLASRAGFDADAFERQWWGLRCVCVDIQQEGKGGGSDAGL